jgi:hypothetical protein
MGAKKNGLLISVFLIPLSLSDKMPLSVHTVTFLNISLSLIMRISRNKLAIEKGP